MILDNGSVRLEVVQSPAQTGGELLDLLATYRAGSPPPPRHFHPYQEERFEVRRGALWFEVDGVERVLAEGDRLVVPPGAVHRARNASADEEAIVVWQVRPALRTLELFRGLYARPNPLKTAALVHEYSREFVLASPPRPIQSCVLAVLAPIARLLGQGPGAGSSAG